MWADCQCQSKSRCSLSLRAVCLRAVAPLEQVQHSGRHVELSWQRWRRRCSRHLCHLHLPQHLKLLVMEGALGLCNVWHTAKRKGAFSHSRLLHKLDNREHVSESLKVGERKQASVTCRFWRS